MNQTSEQHAPSRLANFPVSFFSTIMGMSGLTVAWQKAGPALGASHVIWNGIAAVTAVLFAVLVLVYGLKLVRHSSAVAAEWKHPVRVNFFPTLSISLLLQGVVWLESAPSVAFVLWGAGTVIHFAFTMAILSSWMFHTHYDIKHANPGWFIPVVGNLFVPICAAHFGLLEVGWFFFSVGIVFWLVMMTIVFYRILFHDPIPQRLLPTLFILIAPPAVGFISYVTLTQAVDTFARVLFYSGLFIFLLLAANARRFVRSGFFISSWAYSFPVAAITIAAFVMASRTGDGFFTVLGIALLAILSTIIAALLFKTLGAVGRQAICAPE